MRRARILQIVAAAIALAGCVLFALNVRTSESAWRLANPTEDQGETIMLPEKQPARDAPGRTGWSWSEGTPGWKPGERIQGYSVAGLGPQEIVKAKESALRAGIDGEQTRVLTSLRATRSKLLAVLAAPAAEDPHQTCLAAMLKRNGKVDWVCPGKGAHGREFSDATVFVIAASLDWHAPGTSTHEHPLYLGGVARGDVRRVVLSAPGWDPATLYTRGNTWGQFSAAWTVIDRSARLRVYGASGLLEVVRLSVEPGKTRIFH